MANTNTSVFPQRLGQAIAESGLTQEKLAHAIGIDPPNITYWKSGRNLPRTGHLLAAADLLDVSIDWLFGRDAAAGSCRKSEEM